MNLKPIVKIPNERIVECMNALSNGKITPAVASTLQGLVDLAAKGMLVVVEEQTVNDTTVVSYKTLSTYERINCAIASNAISQHFKVEIEELEDVEDIEEPDQHIEELI